MADTIKGTINANGDCECEVTSEFCNTCADLRENSSDFYINGVTDRVCESLQQNQGFDHENSDDNCSSLHKADDCLVNTLIEKLPAYDVCDWNEFMSEYLPNQYNMNEALICWLCGIEKRLFAQKLDVELRWLNIKTIQGTVTRVDKQGNFTYEWYDWTIEGQKAYGKGILTGKVNFCMKELGGLKAQYQLQNVEIKRIKWDLIDSSGVATTPWATFKVPDKNGAQVFKENLTKSIDYTLNKRYAIGKTGTINQNANSEWINIMWELGEWVRGDENQLQIRFKNGNSSTTVPMCG